MMKKLFIAALVVSGSLVMSSCNNGAYDANPSTDLKAAKNPLDGSSGVTVYLGSMKVNIAGKAVIFNNVQFKVDEANQRIMTGTAINDVLERYFSITWPDQTYKGPNEYKFGKDGGLNFTLNVRDTSIKDRIVYRAYKAASTSSISYITLTVKGDEDGFMRGILEGDLYYPLTDTDEDETDLLQVRKGEFYAEPKK